MPEPDDRPSDDRPSDDRHPGERRHDDRYPDLPVDPDTAAAPPGSGQRAGPQMAWVALGGLFGAPARYAIAQGLSSAPPQFPTATFITNLTGAFLLGALLETLGRRGDDTGGRRIARLLLGTGFLGAFTTYSTLAVDTDLLVRAHRLLLSAGYALGTVIVGALCTVAGIAGASHYHRRRPPERAGILGHTAPSSPERRNREQDR